MNTERHHPPLEIAECLRQSAREQARAIRAGDWDTVFRVADARQGLLEQLAGATASPMAVEDRARLTHLLIEIGEIDVEITQSASTRAREVKAELDECDEGFGVVSGYQWANGTDLQKMIDCYG